MCIIMNKQNGKFSDFSSGLLRSARNDEVENRNDGSGAFQSISRKMCGFCLFVLLFFTTARFYGQEMNISAKIDTTNNEITTFVSLIHISEGGRVRFQQRLAQQAKLVRFSSAFLLWDTAHQILTVITPCYPLVDTLDFMFVCHTDCLPDAILWGEAALMYEDKAKNVQKINYPAKNYIVRQPLISDADSLTKDRYYIQVSASKTVQNKDEIAKLVHLQQEDIILEKKVENYYKYFIGHFITKEQATTQLKYYKQYVSDAFIVQFDTP